VEHSLSTSGDPSGPARKAFIESTWKMSLKVYRPAGDFTMQPKMTGNLFSAKRLLITGGTLTLNKWRSERTSKNHGCMTPTYGDPSGPESVACTVSVESFVNLLKEELCEVIMQYLSNDFEAFEESWAFEKWGNSFSLI